MSGINPEILKESLNFKIAALGNRNSYSDHKKIVFSAGIMILLSSSFKSLLQYIPIIPHLITELKV